MNGEYEYEFGLLHDAMLNDREKARDIVIENRSVLEATNRTGENVLRWFALENCFEEVSLLRSMGSSIQPVTLTEAIEMGNTEMVGLLLELGVEPDIETCRMILRSKFVEITSRKKNIVRNHLKDFGFEI
jgi:hypothetical protein